jgi:hypothetical protein
VDALALLNPYLFDARLLKVAATVEVLPGPGTASGTPGQPALAAPSTGTTGGTKAGPSEAQPVVAAGRPERDYAEDRNSVVPQVSADSAGPAGTTEPRVEPRDIETPVAAATALGSVRGPGPGSAWDSRHLHPVRGSATTEIRALIASGVTDAGTIRAHLAGAGLKVPDASYIRRLVRTTRETSQAPGQYL